MKIYNLSKFYTLNILAYFVWIGYISILMYFCYLNFIYPIIYKTNLVNLEPIVYPMICFFWFYIIVIILFASSVIEWILRLTKVVTTYNELKGPKWIYNFLFWTAIVSLPIVFKLIYFVAIAISHVMAGD